MPVCGPVYGTTPFGAFAVSSLIGALGYGLGIAMQDVAGQGNPGVRLVVFVAVAFVVSMVLHVLFFFGLGYGGGMLASSERPTRTEQRDTSCATLFAGQPAISHISEALMATAHT